jgi:hypothetical protein
MDGLARANPARYLSFMRVSKTKAVTFALAAIFVMGTLDAAAARHRRHVSHRTVVHSTSRDIEFSSRSGIPVENGTPVIMKGYHPPRVAPDTGEPREHAERPVHIPRGSSTYIPPPVPSPYSSNSPPASSLTRLPPPNPTPAPITTFGDRVTNAIHDYPLQKGIGNNPTDMQSFIRQRANQ